MDWRCTATKRYRRPGAFSRNQQTRERVSIRALIVHCARAVVARQKVHSPWLTEMLRTKHWNVAVVAQANKIARVIWALLAHDRDYRADYAIAA